MREICKEEDTIDHDLISLPDLDTEEQEADLIDQTTISQQIADRFEPNDDIDNQSSELEIDSAKTGRWTKAEHELFLQGIKIHNKQWKMVAKVVKTRTVVQVRTHAQKYFQKLEKIQFRKSSKGVSNPGKVSSGKVGESDSISSSKSSCTDEAETSDDAEKTATGKKSFPKISSPAASNTGAYIPKSKDKKASQLIMRTQSMSAMDQNSKFPNSSSSSSNIETHSISTNKSTPHLLQIGPQKRAREEGFPVENAVYNNVMFPTSHLVYQPQYNYTSPTKTNVNAMNRCYTFDNWDTSSSRMYNMYDTTSIGGSEEVNDQALISMLNTIDWSSHSRSPDHSNSAPAIVPECGRCSPLNPNAATSINDDLVELRKPIPTHISNAVPVGQLRAADENNTERNSSISGSSDDASTLVATTTDEDISTSTSYDSKFSTSVNSPSDKRPGGPVSNPLSSQPNSVQEVPQQPFFKFSLFRGYNQNSEPSSNQNIQGFLATPRIHEHLTSPHVFDPRFRHAMQTPQNNAVFMNGNVRSISRSSSDSFDTHPEDTSAATSPMMNSFYSPVGYNQKYCQNEMEILRSVSSTDELNQRMPSLSIISCQQQQQQQQQHVDSNSKSSSVKRRGRPRKVPITPARSTSTFTSFNSNSKAGPNSSSGISSKTFIKDAPPTFPSIAYGSCSTNRISPIPELSPTNADDQNDSANEHSNSSSPSLNELLVGT
eukprot:gene21908-28363_t